MGGLAIICGFTISLVFDLATASNIITPGRELLGLVSGMVIIIVMGILDDTRTLKAWVKLLFQIGAAVCVVAISGTKISHLTNPFGSDPYIELSPYISIPLTILWIVGITNAINLIDGLDGLAAGISSISSLSLFFVTLLRADLDPAKAVYIALITAALSGSTLGFLPFNFNPAKIFLGETGAAFLGFTLGVISIQGVMKSYAAISIVIPLLVLGLPLFDTLFAIIRRIFTRRSIMQGDRGHLHHRLIDMGLSQRQSVLILYTASASLGLCAIVLADRGAFSAVVMLIAAAVFIVGGAKYINDRGLVDDRKLTGDTRSKPAMPEEDVNKSSDGVTK